MAHRTRLGRLNSVPTHWFTNLRDALRRWLKLVRDFSDHSALRRRPRTHFVRLCLEGFEERIVPTNTLSFVEGASSGGLIATFTDPTGNPNGTDQYTGSINWGNGQTTSPSMIMVSGTTIQVYGYEDYGRQGPIR